MWEFLGWVGVVCVAAVMVALTAAVVMTAVRSIRTPVPSKAKSERVI